MVQKTVWSSSEGKLGALSSVAFQSCMLRLKEKKGRGVGGVIERIVWVQSKKGRESGVIERIVWGLGGETTVVEASVAVPCAIPVAAGEVEARVTLARKHKQAIKGRGDGAGLSGRQG